MDRTIRLAFLEFAGLVVAFVGVVDASRQGEVVLAVLFGVALALGAVRITIRSSSAVRLRDDHQAWLRRASAVTGESIEAVVDRAVGTYRRSLDDGS